MKRNVHRVGFTLVELLVVIGIIALLAGLLLPSLNRAQESARRVKCAGNLRQIGAGLIAYGGDSSGHFPRTFFDPTATAGLIFTNSGRQSDDPFQNMPSAASETSTGVNNVPAAVFLLLRKGILTPEIFVCPSVSFAKADEFKDTVEQEESARGRGNFSNLDYLVGPDLNLTYSIQVPYPSQAGMQSGWIWGTAMDSDAPIAADLNPGTLDDAATVTRASNENDKQKGNSRNHLNRGAKQGQNVLYADGHVEWMGTPYAGKRRKFGTVAERDHIYRAEPASAETPFTVDNSADTRPALQADAVLMPASQF